MVDSRLASLATQPIGLEAHSDEIRHLQTSERLFMSQSKDRTHFQTVDVAVIAEVDPWCQHHLTANVTLDHTFVSIPVSESPFFEG